MMGRCRWWVLASLVALAGCRPSAQNFCLGVDAPGGCLKVEVSGGKAKQTLTQQSGKESYLFVLSSAANNGSVAASSLVPYTLDIRGPGGALRIFSAPPAPALSAPREVSALWARVEAEGEIRRQAEDSLRRARQRFSDDLIFARQAQWAVGNSRTFQILVGSSYTSATFTSSYWGKNIELWVDNDGLSPSAADLQTLGQSIDAIIVPRARALFGAETDLDSNQRVQVLLSGKLNRQGSGRAVPIIGFFNPVDLNRADPHSNQGEYLYAVLPNVAPPGKDPIALSDIQATAAHEMQHLISYANHVAARHEVQEELWLDEGLSHLAEELCGYGAGNFAFINTWLQNVNGGSADVSEGGIAYGNDTPARRGGAMLFLLYPFEQLGGATYGSDPAQISGGGVDLLHALIANKTTQNKGIGALSNVLGRHFKDLLATFGLMLALDGTGLRPEPLFNLLSPVDDPLTGQPRWLHVLGSSRAVPGVGRITLGGPAQLSWKSGWAAEVAPSGFDFVRYNNAAAGEIAVEFSGANQADHFFFIVRLEDHS